MEMFILAGCMRMASAERVTAVMPYLPYGKQSKLKKRGSIPARLVAQLVEVAGFNMVITVDLHHNQLQGFFTIPVINLKATPLLVKYTIEHIAGARTAVVVAKNTGASKRAALFAKRLNTDFALIFGEQTKFADLLSEEMLTLDGSAEAAMAEEVDAGVREDSGGLAACVATEEDSYGTSVIGSVDGRDCILVDDIIDTAAPFIMAANLLRKNGAARIILVATHGVFAENAAAELQASIIDQVVVLNTISQTHLAASFPKLSVVDCTPLLAEAVRRAHFNESIELIGSGAGKADGGE